jgi:hypothetical protein
VSIALRRAGAATALAAAAASGVAAPAAVTPSGDTVPENLLRIELHLARPLARPLAMDHVRLVDAEGATIEDAFLDLPLPGDGGRTITLLLHPGRVKRGVGANLALGRALHAGADAALVVDDPQLPRPLHKRWHVTPPIERRMQPAQWQLAMPRAGSTAALQVALDAPLTAASAAWIALRGPDGERVAGTAWLDEGETRWRFRPAPPRRAGPNGLVAHPRLEDVAGNRACTPFEAAGLDAMACDAEEPGFDLRP